MDMAVANLFKKIRFTFEGVHTEIYEPMCFKRTRYYRSPTIENVESIGLNDVNDLCTIFCKPLVLYAFSKVIHEDRVIPIDSIRIKIGIINLEEYDERYLTCYCFEDPLDSPELFFSHADIGSCSFPKHLLKTLFYVFVKVKSYYICSTLRQEARFRL